MLLKKTEIKLGLPEPLKVMHISDSHFCLADARDGQRKIDLAGLRIKYHFGDSHEAIERNIDEQIAYGKNNCDLIVHTGDIIDFRSIPNLEIMRRKLEYADAFYAVGSHEFSLYIGEAEEDTAYKMQSWDMISASSLNALDFAVRIVKGVRFISMDNSYYRFTPEQLAALKQELQKEMPTVICVHTPLFEEEFFHRRLKDTGNNYTCLVATPDKYRIHYPENQIERQKPDEATWAMYHLITTTPQIKAVLAGHLHEFYEVPLPGGAIQICGCAGYNNEAVEVTFV